MPQRSARAISLNRQTWGTPNVRHERRSRHRSNWPNSSTLVPILLTVLGVGLGSELPAQQAPAHKDDVAESTLQRLLSAEFPARPKGEPQLSLQKSPKLFHGLLPDDSVFVAAVEWDDALIALYDVPYEVGELPSFLLDRLERARFLPKTSSGRGFVRDARGFPLTVCRTGESILISATSDGDEQTHLAVRHHAVDQRQCDPDRRIGPHAQYVPIPSLRGPTNDAVSSSGSTSGSGSANLTATVVTRKSPSELATTFAVQLEQQTWVAGALNDLGPLAFQAFTLHQESGVAWLAILTTQTSQVDGELRAELKIQRIGAAR